MDLLGPRSLTTGILLILVSSLMLTAPGCRQAALPEKLTGAVITFYTDNGRIEQVRAELNKTAPVPVLSAQVSRASVNGMVHLSGDSSIDQHIAVLLEYFQSALEYLDTMCVTPIPKIDLRIQIRDSIPKTWQGVLTGSTNSMTVHADLYCTSSEIIKQVGKWRKLDNFLASQILGLLHELIEISFMYGNGALIGYGNESRLRWLREGLASYLAEQTLKRFFVCNPFFGSQLEYKFYYATEMGGSLLDWNETSGSKWLRGYSASLGFMNAAYEATKGQFPRHFLTSLAENRTTDPRLCIKALSDVLGCDPREFAQSIRRPLPELVCAEKEGKPSVPKNFSSSDAPALLTGDVLLSIDGRRVTTHFEVDETLWAAGLKDEFLISIRRGRDVLDIPCRPVVWRSMLEKAVKQAPLQQ